MHPDDERIFKTFEEFEREELRRTDASSSPVDRMIDSIFEEELAFAGLHATWREADDEE